MIIAKAKVGRTTITLKFDMVCGLYEVTKGSQTMWVADNEESAKAYYKTMTAA